jgi:hypothetical protein
LDSLLLLEITDLAVFPEKAGVGGSTPSRGTIFPKDLDDWEQNSSVRSQSAVQKGISHGFSTYLQAKNLSWGECSSVRFQSALLPSVPENRCKHRP